MVKRCVGLVILPDLLLATLQAEYCPKGHGFRCEECDFDGCEKCYMHNCTQTKLCAKGHLLIPMGVSTDTDWGCANASTKTGCLRQNVTKGVTRFRQNLSFCKLILLTLPMQQFSLVNLVIQKMSAAKVATCATTNSVTFANRHKRQKLLCLLRQKLLRKLWLAEA